jgi:hypothetical protein
VERADFMMMVAGDDGAKIKANETPPKLSAIASKIGRSLVRMICLNDLQEASSAGSLRQLIQR